MDKFDFLTFLNKKRFSRALVAVSGILLAVAFHFESLWWLCLIALIPFCTVMLFKTHTYREIFSLTLIFGIAYYCCLLPWLFEIASVIASGVGDIAANVIMALAIVAISIVMGIAHALPMLLFKRLRKGGAADAFILSVLYVSGELIISLMGKLAFPWGRLANIAVPCLPFVQSASLGGGLLVSLIIMLINSLVTVFAVYHTKNRRRAYLSLASAAVILAVNILGGIIAIEVKQNQYADVPTVEALTVQGNFPSNDKWSTSTADMLDRYLTLSAQGVTDKTKLVVWPETAIPTDLDKNKNLSKKIQTLADQYNVTVVVGYIKETADGTFNAMRLYCPGDDLSDSTPDETVFYAKQLLVPMGEFTPFSEIIGVAFPEAMGDLASRDLTHGDKTVVFDTAQGKLNGIICYESILPSLQLDASRNGSGLITMITNDSWFGTSTALRQHLSHAQLRAVENGKYLIRAGNSGITAVITPYGEISGTIATYQSGYLLQDVSYLYDTTPYVAIGDIPFYSLIGCCIILFVLDIIRQRKDKKCRISTINPAE